MLPSVTFKFSPRKKNLVPRGKSGPTEKIWSHGQNIFSRLQIMKYRCQAFISAQNSKSSWQKNFRGTKIFPWEWNGMEFIMAIPLKKRISRAVGSSHYASDAWLSRSTDVLSSDLHGYCYELHHRFPDFFTHILLL